MVFIAVVVVVSSLVVTAISVVVVVDSSVTTLASVVVSADLSSSFSDLKNRA